MARIGVDAGGVLSRKEASAAREATPAVRGAVWGMRTLLHLCGHDNVFIVSRVRGDRGTAFLERFCERNGLYRAGLSKKMTFFSFFLDRRLARKTMPPAETRKRGGDEQRY